MGPGRRGAAHDDAVCANGLHVEDADVAHDGKGRLEAVLVDGAQELGSAPESPRAHLGRAVPRDVHGGDGGAAAAAGVVTAADLADRNGRLDGAADPVVELEAAVRVEAVVSEPVSLHQQPVVLCVLADEAAVGPAHEDVAVVQLLEAAALDRVPAVGSLVVLDHARGPVAAGLVVQFDNEAAGEVIGRARVALLVCPGVVQKGDDGPVLVAFSDPRVMLTRPDQAVKHTEVGLLASGTPDDVAVGAVDEEDETGVAQRDEEVAVLGPVDGVEMAGQCQYQFLQAGRATVSTDNGLNSAPSIFGRSIVDSSTSTCSCVTHSKRTVPVWRSRIWKPVRSSVRLFC